MTAASRSLATALWRARFASGLLRPSYTTCGDRTLAAYLKQGFRLLAPWFYGMIAALEAEVGHGDDALPTLDEGLALAEETGEHWKHPLLFRRQR